MGNHYRLYVLDTSYIPVRNGITSGVGGLNGLNYNQPLFGEPQPTIPPALQIGVPKDLVFQGQNRRSNISTRFGGMESVKIKEEYV